MDTFMHFYLKINNIIIIVRRCEAEDIENIAENIHMMILILQ